MSAEVKDLFTLWLVQLDLLAVRDLDVRKVWYEKTVRINGRVCGGKYSY